MIRVRVTGGERGIVERLVAGHHTLRAIKVERMVPVADQHGRDID